MDAYIQDIINDIESNKVKKCLFVTVGPSGAGKSTLVKELCRQIKLKFNENASVHSLDDYRTRCNNGKYPSTIQEHAEVNKKAIPLYRQCVMDDISPVIILDNTHLKWDPDWQLPLEKASKEQRHLVTILPLVTEYFLLSNRSTHLTDKSASDTLLKMCARWPGNRMAHLLNRCIESAILYECVPNKADSFTINKMFHVPWGRDGFLYVLDNYLGYVDRNMIIHAIKAGNVLKSMKKQDYFLRKDSLLHVTLIQPKTLPTDVLKQFAVQLCKKGNPPSLEYTGIGWQKKNQSTTYYMTIDKHCQMQWEQLVNSISRGDGKKKPSLFNSDGIHVTLGYDSTDVHGVDKRKPEKMITQAEWHTIPIQFHWHWKESLTKRNLSDTLDLEGRFLTNVLHNVPDVMKIGGAPDEILQRLGLFVSHADVRCKWRQEYPLQDCKDAKDVKDRYYSLGIQVNSRFKSDDELYKKFPLFQKGIPRGLTLLFKWDHQSGVLFLVGTVFPTGKFFGDNDEEEDVVVMRKEELSEMQQGGDYFIVTEKANGEMFSFTPMVKMEKGWLVMAGSKNNKFAFLLRTDAQSKEEYVEEYMRTIRKHVGVNDNNQLGEMLKNPSWTSVNPWAEMCVSFFDKLWECMDATKFEKFMTELAENKETLCAEFESFLHPHLLSFPRGHKRNVIFAVTTYDENFNCCAPDVFEQKAKLEKLRDEYALDVVKMYETNETLEQLRVKTRDAVMEEGVVLWKISGGKLQQRIKMKTLYYVVHRGFREKLRRILQDAKKQNNVIPKRLRPLLMDTLKQKFDIFSLDVTENVGVQYTIYIDKLVAYVEKEAWKDFNSLWNLFLYDYPRLMYGAGAIANGASA